MRVKLVRPIPIGFVRGEPIFPFRGADSGAGDGDGGDGNASDQDEDDGDNGADDDDKPDADSGQDSSVIRKMRRDLRKAQRELIAAKKLVDEKNLADKSEVERSVAERDAATVRADNAEGQLRDALIKLEVLAVSGRKKYDWNDLEDVLNDRKLLEAIDYSDGEIDGVEDALKDLARRKPHFLRAKKSDSDGDDAGAQSGRTGAKFNGTKDSKDRQVDRDRLLKQYPMLQHMVE
jgi:hypothetical protein